MKEKKEVLKRQKYFSLLTMSFLNVKRLRSTIGFDLKTNWLFLIIVVVMLPFLLRRL